MLRLQSQLGRADSICLSSPSRKLPTVSLSRSMVQVREPRRLLERVSETSTVCQPASYSGGCCTWSGWPRNVPACSLDLVAIGLATTRDLLKILWLSIFGSTFRSGLLACRIPRCIFLCFAEVHDVEPIVWPYPRDEEVEAMPEDGKDRNSKSHKKTPAIVSVISGGIAGGIEASLTQWCFEASRLRMTILDDRDLPLRIRQNTRPAAQRVRYQVSSQPVCDRQPDMAGRRNASDLQGLSAFSYWRCRKGWNPLPLLRLLQEHV